MAYGIRYRISYYRKSGGRTTIDIRDKAFSSDSITDLLATQDPLHIPFDGDITNIYQPTIGSGASISVVTTPLALTSLITEDPQKFKVQIYNGVSGSSLVWQGFVNTEVYSEDYNIPASILRQATIQCSDGMALLDDILYDATIGGYLTGDKTIAEVFAVIFSALSLTFNYVYSCHDLSVAVSSETNLWTYLKTCSENYTNEKFVQMSCRDVLNAIIGGLGLVMFFRGGNIYIIDPINLHTTSNGKQYTLPTFSSETTVATIGGYLDISSAQIRWGAFGAVLDITPSLPEAFITYDPYNLNDYIHDLNDSTNWTTVGSFTGQDGSTWYRNTAVQFKNITSTYDDSTVGVKEKIDSEPTFFISLYKNLDVITYTVPGSNLSTDNMINIKLSLDAWIQTTGNDFNIYSSAAKTQIYGFYIQFSIKVGNLYWKDDHWEAGQTGNYVQLISVRDFSISDAEYVANNSLSQVGDTWTTVSKIIQTIPGPGGSNISGQVQIIFYGNWVQASVTPQSHWTGVNKVFIKDVHFECTNYNNGKNIGNDGVETNGKITAMPSAKGTFEIHTLHGTGTYGCSRGAFKGTTSGVNISGLYRASNIYTNAQLLLQSINTQYKQARFVLKGKLDAQANLLLTPLKLIKDSTYMGTKAFYIASGTYNDREETMDVTMVETIDTREAIV